MRIVQFPRPAAIHAGGFSPMNITENTTLAHVPEEDEPTGRVLRLVTECYHLLAGIHEALAEATLDPGEGQEHVTNATRELAAIQQLFDRRGRGR